MFYEASHNEYSIGKFIEHYQNAMPQLIMIRRGYMGDARSNTLDTQQVLRIHDVHSERRVLAKVTKDLSNCFGCGDVTLSMPVTFPVPMCCVKKSGSLKTAKLLQNILQECKLPVTVQLMDTTNHEIQLEGKMVLLTGDVKLSLEKEYDEKYMYGNPVNNGQLFRNVISFPSCTPNITLSVITGLESHNDEHWRSILGSMDYTVTKYINFDGKIGSTEILKCPKPSFNSEEPKDDTFIETSNTYSSFRKVKHKQTYCFENQTPLTEDKHVDNMTNNVDANTQNRSSYPDNLRLGKNDISPFPSSPALSNNKVSNMRYDNPDSRSISIKGSPFYCNQEVKHAYSLKKDDSVTDPSTLKTDLPQNMISVGEPSVHSEDTVRACDNTIVKPVNSSSDIDSLSVQDLGLYLHIMNIGQYSGQLSDAQIDGTLLKEMDEQILIEDFGFKRFEAIKLMKFARDGYLPNVKEHTHF